MFHFPCQIQCFFFFSLFSVVALVRANPRDGLQHDREGSLSDPGLARYVSRPDLRVAKWDLTFHNRSLNSPGYWFVAPYKSLNGAQSDQSWVGPCIYDGETGELIWSGGRIFNSNVEDFRISNVNGERLMTLMAHSNALILNNDYTIRKSINLNKGRGMNTHELNFVENGTRVLYLDGGRQMASREESRRIGFEGECAANFDGFSEVDVTNDEDWQQKFSWQSHGRIGLEESTLTAGLPEGRCDGWDFIHANSVDKTPEGDYLFSARHTDTIYKISGRDGSITWRLGGVKSDFDLQGDGMVFSRQHNIRYRGQNDTHLLVSMLDNAKGIDPQPATWDFSRGLLIAIDEKNMRAAVERHYDHPYGNRGSGYAPRRGNYQLLPSGNIFMGWSERAIQSEHTPDGELIWEATLQVDWMGSYRSYKFDGFVGKPVELPSAVSRAYSSDNATTTTTVHVSWNGATEVALWRLYRTSSDGEMRRSLVAAVDKLGFETALLYSGYARFVVVDAIDKDGKAIGRSSVVQTYTDANISAAAIAEEERWLMGLEDAEFEAEPNLSNLIVACFVGLACGVIVTLVVVEARKQEQGVFHWCFRRGQRYTPVSQGNADVSLRAWHANGLDREARVSEDEEARPSKEREAQDSEVQTNVSAK